MYDNEKKNEYVIMLLINDIFIIGFIVFLVGSIAMMLAKMQIYKIIFISVIYIYTVIVLGLTLFPIPYQAAPHMSSVPNNLVPFKTIISVMSIGITYTSIIQIGGNILISVPYGAIVWLLEKKKGILTVLRASLFAVTVEFLQFLIGHIIGVAYRSVDIDDFILNTIGVFVGYYICSIFLRGKKDKINSMLKWK